MTDGHATLAIPIARDGSARRPGRRVHARVLAAAVCLLTIVAIGTRLEAQPLSQVPKIGLLSGSTSSGIAVLVEAFRRGMRVLGHVEGKTFVLEARYAEGKPERLPELARELVAQKVDVIVASTDEPIAAVRRATRTIPIVMMNSTDPVGTGLVASLARPGGNVTGLSNISPDLSGKRLALFKEVVPGLSRVALIWNPDARGNILDYKESEAAASSLHLKLEPIEVSSASDLDRALSTVATEHAQAMMVLPGNPVAFARRAEIASFAQKNRLPSMYGLGEYVDAGGLLSYGPNTLDIYRRAATYVDKILKEVQNRPICRWSDRRSSS
jgi:putative tryptophan/tyrosine transport system substrate-binding protein